VRAANAYNEDTDVDSDGELPATATLPLPQLHDFFDGKCFHLHEELSTEVRSTLKRYIVAFRG
jgi:DNA-repair protein XRCC1